MQDAQLTHNDKASVLPLSIEAGDYVLIRTHALQNYKVQTKRRGPIKFVEEKSSLVLVVESTAGANRMAVHAQRMIP